MHSEYTEDLDNKVDVESAKERLTQRTRRKSFYNLRVWMEQVMLYPMSEIYAGKININDKEYKRLEKICEDIFRFTAVKATDRLVKRELAGAWRELEVALKLSVELPVKPEYISDKKAAFLDVAKDFIKLMEDTYKRDPILKNYYYGWKVPYQEIKELVYEL